MRWAKAGHLDARISLCSWPHFYAAVSGDSNRIRKVMSDHPPVEPLQLQNRDDVILDVGGKLVSTPQDVKSDIADARHQGKKAVLCALRPPVATTSRPSRSRRREQDVELN